jgi:hypothetical protein
MVRSVSSLLVLLSARVRWARVRSSRWTRTLAVSSGAFSYTDDSSVENHGTSASYFIHVLRHAGQSSASEPLISAHTLRAHG